ncbi:MAG: thiamine diphosphokinase [Erysipelotrichales bacterium]|nr:thiamine diphosphokinase [Erysipelotrichales bacterium]MBQ5541849.1 thiamine diphosphokinase [Erysipelotrichales bacterium]
MKKEVRILAGNAKEVPLREGDWIGCDYGAYLLAENGISMVLAVGDFDSVKDTDLIRQYAKEFVKLNPVKNESDLEEAVAYAKTKYEHMTVYGALGGRIDHEISALRLITERNEPIVFENAQNRVFRLDDGVFTIPKDKFTYLSFFALNEAEITLEGVKYPLEKRRITPRDLYLLSNEILKEEAIVKLKGPVLVIQSSDKK